MPYYKKLIGQKSYLSPCRLEDAAKWAEWDNDLEVTIPMGDEAYIPMPLEKEQELIGDDIRKQTHLFDILTLDGDVLIGRCFLFDIDSVNRKAMLGIAIGEKTCWNHGYGQESIRLLLDYGFNLLNLNSVMLGTFSFNERAIQCYRRAGFKEIGKRRQARIIAGKKYDLVLMDILAEEFESVYVAGLVARGATRPEEAG